jgi:hypothetical protein
MPTHQAGDLLIAWGFRNNASPATIGDGWNLIQPNTGANSVSRTFGYQYAASGAVSFGTWTNATIVGVAVFRADGTLRIAGSGTGSANSLTIQYVNAFSRTDLGTLYMMGAIANLTTNIEEAPDNFATLESTNDGTREAAHFLSQTAPIGSQTSKILTGTAANSCMLWCELIEVASGSGLSPALINSQALVRGIVI